jgi:hypothetical protein
MKLFPLIILLSISIHAAMPVGSKGYVPITIDKTKCDTTVSHFAWPVNLKSLPAGWWNNITVAGDIVVTDTLGNIKNRFVDLDFSKSGDSGTVWIDASVSTSLSRRYFVHAVPGAAAANSATVFTSMNCLVRHSFDGPASPLADACGNYNATNVGSILAQPAKLGKSVAISNADGNTYMTLPAITQMQGATHWTITCLFYPVQNLTTLQVIFSEANSCPMVYLRDLEVFVYFGAGNYLTMANSANFITLNTWNKITVTYNGAGLTDQDKIHLYFNGTLMTTTTTGGSVAAAFPGTIGLFYYGWTSPYSFIGSEDESRQYTDTKSAGWELTEYNSIFDAAATTYGAMVAAPARRNFGYGYRYGF